MDDSAKLFEEAQQIATKIYDFFPRLEALSFIAQSLAQSKKLDKAIQIANGISNSYEKSQALSSIVNY